MLFLPWKVGVTLNVLQLHLRITVYIPASVQFVCATEIVFAEERTAEPAAATPEI